MIKRSVSAGQLEDDIFFPRYDVKSRLILQEGEWWVVITMSLTKKPSPAMYSDYLPSGVQSERRERAYVDTGCHTYKSSRPATSSVNQSRAWSVMVTQSSSKEIWKRRPWSVMATQSSNTEICKRRPRSAVVTQSSSKEDLEKKATVSGQSVVQQGRFGKEGHGQWSVSRPTREIWKRRPWSVVSQSSSKGDLEKKAMVSGQSVVQQGRFGKEGHGQWSVSRPAGTFPKEGHDGYSVIQQGDLENPMVSDGYSVVQQGRFGKEGHCQ